MLAPAGSSVTRTVLRFSFSSLSQQLTMPRRTVSRDLKDRIPILHYKHGYKVSEICGVLGVRKSLVYQTLAYHRLYGTCINLFIRKARRH